MEVGDRIKLSRFDNFKVDWRQVEEKRTFEAFHDLNDGKVLRYTCQLEAPDEVKALLDKIEQAKFFSYFYLLLVFASLFVSSRIYLAKHRRF